MATTPRVRAGATSRHLRMVSGPSHGPLANYRTGTQVLDQPLLVEFLIIDIDTFGNPIPLLSSIDPLPIINQHTLVETM